jgi:hypothetical protein
MEDNDFDPAVAIAWWVGLNIFGLLLVNFRYLPAAIIGDVLFNALIIVGVITYREIVAYRQSAIFRIRKTHKLMKWVHEETIREMNKNL